MPTLANYHHFDGLHQDTGPIHNALAYQGMQAPHTGKPLSEAFLLGVSGGIAFGYFTFEYQGYEPHIALLTRNTFSPMETIYDRLAIPRDVLQTQKPATAMENLIETLESGSPALVWVDMFSMPYTLNNPDERRWGTLPVLVYGVEGDTVYIADRSRQPLTVTVDELMRARGRVKEDRYRIVVLGAPDMDKLPAAAQKGIWQCISLYTDAPPKGKRENFGFAALQNWADMLVNTRNKQGWERYFPPGSRLFSALAGDVVQPGAFDWICTWGAAGGAERGLYADFLEEVIALLNKPGLQAAVDQFRRAEAAWCELANALLPDSVPLLKETRDLKLKRHELFIQQGMNGLDKIRAINGRLDEIRQMVGQAFPMSEAEVKALRENLREHVLRILDIEREAVAALQEAMQ